MQIDNPSQSVGDASTSKTKTTKQIIFIAGQTNPMYFLNEFEKCRDVTNEKDKMYKIRNFVDGSHRGKNSIS